MSYENRILAKILKDYITRWNQDLVYKRQNEYRQYYYRHSRIKKVKMVQTSIRTDEQGKN